MKQLRPWLVLIFGTVVLLGTAIEARSAAARAVEPPSIPCAIVRLAVARAGGLGNAIREALERGYRQAEIEATIRRCKLPVSR